MYFENFSEKLEQLLVDQTIRYDRVQLGDNARRYTLTNFVEKETRLAEAINNYHTGRSVNAYHLKDESYDEISKIFTL